MALDKPRSTPTGEDLAAAIGIEELRCPFGPLFFLGHLRSFVRERCPEPSETRPVVRLHLVGGDVLDVCHVIGLAQGFVALAVYEDAGRGMRTEIVPYLAIARVTIQADRRESEIGFGQKEPPLILADKGAVSAEDLLERAAASPTA